MPNGNGVAAGDIPVSCTDGLSALQDPQKSGFFLWKDDGRVSKEAGREEKVQKEKRKMINFSIQHEHIFFLYYYGDFLSGQTSRLCYLENRGCTSNLKISMKRKDKSRKQKKKVFFTCHTSYHNIFLCCRALTQVSFSCLDKICPVAKLIIFWSVYTPLKSWKEEKKKKKTLSKGWWL